MTAKKSQTLELFSPVNKIVKDFSDRFLIFYEALKFEDWDQAGVDIMTIANGSRWWIGDWILHGENKYGEGYAQAQLITGRSYDTIAQYKHVAKVYPPEDRKFDLPFSFYLVVASLDKRQRNKLLKDAETNDWTKAELVYEAKKLLLPPEDDKDDKDKSTKTAEHNPSCELHVKFNRKGTFNFTLELDKDEPNYIRMIENVTGNCVLIELATSGDMQVATMVDGKLDV